MSEDARAAALATELSTPATRRIRHAVDRLLLVRATQPSAEQMATSIF